MSQIWSVQDAKARLSEILRRARAGEPQKIGTKDACIVVSADVWESRQTPKSVGKLSKHVGEALGAWLVRTAPKIGVIELPSRKSKRPIPFSDLDDDE